MSTPALAAPAKLGQSDYRLERIALKELTGPQRDSWARFAEQHIGASLYHNPDWLVEHYKNSGSQIVVYFLYHGDRLAGIAPFLLKRWPLKWQIGELTIARLPLTRLCLLGGGAALPKDPAAYELLFSRLSAERCNAVYLEHIPTNSDLWEFVGSNVKNIGVFWRYMPEPPNRHILLTLDETFDGYFAKFSAKHRNTLRRKVRLLQKATDDAMEIKRITEAEQVIPFLNDAIMISKKTYQWNLLGLGLRSRDDLLSDLLLSAKMSYLRSYLLLCRGEPAAFILGSQFKGEYVLEDMGYDPAWRDYSAGQVLHLKMIEDLFSHNRPNVYNLGDFGTHKEEFGNSERYHGKAYLFRKTPYTLLVSSGHRATELVSRTLSSLLHRFGLKRKLKNAVRRWSMGASKAE